MALVLLAVGARAQTFEEGRAAYLRHDYETARTIWSVLAERHDASAEFALGTLYHEGDLGPRDPAEAVRWFRLAAEQGFAAAQFNLGNAYHRGDGVEQSDDAASDWWKKAADQEFAPAQFNLATQYLYGRGVPRDVSIAAIYYRRAAENGHPAAPAALRRLEVLEQKLHADESATAVRSGPVPRASPASGIVPGSGAVPTMATGTGPAQRGWIDAQDPGWFTVQIAALGSEERARSFISEHSWPHPVGYVPVVRNGKRLYSVLYGAFPDRGSAEAAVRSLSPTALGGGRPWIRRIGGVQIEVSR